MEAENSHCKKTAMKRPSKVSRKKNWKGFNYLRPSYWTQAFSNSNEPIAEPMPFILYMVSCKHISLDCSVFKKNAGLLILQICRTLISAPRRNLRRARWKAGQVFEHRSISQFCRQRIMIKLKRGGRLFCWISLTSRDQNKTRTTPWLARNEWVKALQSLFSFLFFIALQSTKRLRKLGGETQLLLAQVTRLSRTDSLSQLACLTQLPPKYMTLNGQ